MRFTQRDIATRCQVSQATVSRVLSGDPRVEADARQTILDAMAELNYRPDTRARSLRKQRSELIGLVIRRPENGLSDDPFFGRLVSAILERLAGTSFHLCIDLAQTSIGESSVYEELLRSRRVDGLILVEPMADDVRIANLQSDNFPFVLIGNPTCHTSVWSVDNDNRYAGRLATQHLIEQGFSKIHFLAGPERVAFSEERTQGYVDAMKAAQISTPVIWNTDFGSAPAQRKALEILAGPNCPDAVVVLDDFMATGVLQAAHALGIKVPDDLGIVSFNDSRFCSFVGPGLSSMNLNIGQVVEQAVTMLLDLIEGHRLGAATRVIVPCSLTVRGSSVRAVEGAYR